MTKSREEIIEQIDLACDNNGKFHGMSYEDGVQAALEWVLYDTDEKPMED